MFMGRKPEPGGAGRSREEPTKADQTIPNQTIRDPKEPRETMCIQCSHRHKYTNRANKRPKPKSKSQRAKAVCIQDQSSIRDVQSSNICMQVEVVYSSKISV